jgi:hypothetical protein
VDEREQLERDGAALRSHLQARIDLIEVGGLVTYLARPRRRDRLIQAARFSFAVAGTALLLVAALIVGTQFRLSRVTPAASPTASPAPPIGLSPKYGIVALTRDGFVVRSETDPNPIRKIETSHLFPDTVAVSRNGRLVAYWRQPTAGEDRGDVLMLYDATTNADPRPLLKVPNENGGPLVWADDDSGIAFASQIFRGPAPGPPMKIQIVEIADGVAKAPAKLLSTVTSDESRVIRPVAWIRETRTVSAIEGTIEGVATNYVKVGEDGSVKRFAVSSGDQVVRLDDVIADPQTRTLAYLVTFRCQDGTPGCTLIRFWTLEDPQQALGWQANPGTTFAHLLWQPFTRNLLVLTRMDRDRSLTLQVWSSPHFGSSQSIPLSQSDTSLLLVRPDGRAIFVGALSGSWRADLIPLDGSAPSIAADLTTNGGGAPTLSLSLDSSEADRIAALPPAAPLLAESEVEAQVRKTVGFPDHIDQLTATFERGSYPFAGRVPTWTVRATGEFRQILRGVFASTPPPAHCAIWTFNARTGMAIGVQATDAIGDCS